MHGYRPSSYGDAFADVYDDWYADVGDLEGCASAIAAAHAELCADRASDSGSLPVLELGAGTGRLAAPIRSLGIPVIGLDASMSMLQRFGTRAELDGTPRVCADLARLPLRGPVGGAVLAFNTLFNLTSRDAQARFFHEIAGVLVPGGFVVAELFLPSLEDGVPDAVVEPTRFGMDTVVLTASVRDRATQIVQGQHIELSERGIRLRPWVIRYADPDELDALAADAGLELARRDASWRADPFGPAAAQHVSWWRRPGRPS